MTVPTSNDRPPRRVAWFAAAATIILLWSFWSFFRIQWRWVQSDLAEWAHTLLAPIGAVFLVWIDRDRLASLKPGPGILGPLLIVAGGTWFTISTCLPIAIVNSHNSRGFAVVVCVTGIAATMLGRGSWRVLWFPALYLMVFGQCIGSRVLAPITHELQQIAANWGFHLVGMFGFTAMRSGTVISVLHDGEWSPVNVAEACSGIRMLPAVFAGAVPIGWWILDRIWTRGVFLLATLLLALVLNAMRIVFMAVLATRDDRVLDGDLHSAISDVWTLPVLVLAIFVAWALVPFNRDDPESEASEPSAPIVVIPGATLAQRIAAPRTGRLVLTVLILIASGLALRVATASLGIEAQKREAALRQPLATLPPTLGPWRRIGEDNVLDSQTIEVLGTPHYLERTYARSSGGSDDAAGALKVHIAYYSGDPDESPHVPEVCWVGQGMTIDGPAELRPLRLSIPGVRVEPELVNLDTDEPYPLVDLVHPVTRRVDEVALPIGELTLRISRFKGPNEPRTLHLGGYFFIANGRLTPRAGDVRSLAFQLYQRYSYWMKVEFDAVVPAGPEESEAIDDYVERVESLLSAMLPELMRRLPHWPTLEREGRGG